MKLITEVSIPEYPFSIGHRKGILMMGSCFTDNIGSLLERYRFPVTVNPFGTVFNPASVKAGLEALMERDAYAAADLDQHGGRWFSFDHYTGFSAADREECLEKINAAFVPAKKVLRDAGCLVITWGTSWIFREKQSGRIVSNCHRIPASRFDRSRLSPGDISRMYRELLLRLFGLNPDRHWKDGARGNQLSKASLLLAAEELEADFPDKVFYFPSYEIVMDELRDYRFYAADLLHTNEMAAAYIWEKFRKALISDESREIIGVLDPLLKLIEHRPRDSSEKVARELREQQEELIASIRGKYPFIAL
jgi:hypothetical protein